MQIDKARKLREQNDTDNCQHEILDKEYHKGAATGDYTCRKCGESRMGSNWNKSILKLDENAAK